MRFTAQEECGLRCMVQIARHDGPDPVTIHEIAEAEHLTPAYVGKLMRVLRQGGLVEGVHGPSGGYRLNRPAAEIPVGEILNVLDGRLFEGEACQRAPGDLSACIHTNECTLRSLWATLEQFTGGLLNSLRLSDLVRPEQSLAQIIRDRMPATLTTPAARLPGGLPR